jgi:hypothetical protein
MNTTKHKIRFIGQKSIPDNDIGILHCKKDKVIVTGPVVAQRRVEVQLYSSKASALEGVSGQQHGPAAIYPRERPGTHCTGSWVGPRAGLEGRKISPPPGFDPRTAQPVVSRYTD